MAWTLIVEAERLGMEAERNSSTLRLKRDSSWEVTKRDVVNRRESPKKRRGGDLAFRVCKKKKGSLENCIELYWDKKRGGVGGGGQN